MRKIEGVRARLQPPVLEGRPAAEVTLVGWGSTWSVIQEAAEALNRSGLPTNQLHFKYLHPFHGTEARAILERCKKVIAVENNFSGQFARHLRAESGFGVHHVLTRYDGEPFEPAYIAQRVRALAEGRRIDLKVEEHEAREMAYHYVRIHLQDKARPGRMHQVSGGSYGEPLWAVELVNRADGRPEGLLVIGMETGAVHGWRPVVPSLLAEPALPVQLLAQTQDLFSSLLESVPRPPAGPPAQRAQ
jgi:hypothetical protein